MSDPIMEDVKHWLMWDIIIDIFNKVRNNEIQFDENEIFEYTAAYPKTNKISIKLYWHYSVPYIKSDICDYVFKDLDINQNCYLCMYDLNIDRSGKCTFCPAKIETPVRKNCLNGYFSLVNWVTLDQLPYLEEDVFNVIIHYCKKIRDIEYKEGVILRSQLDNQSVQFKPFDKVLVRNFDHDEWRASFFSHLSSNYFEKYYCVDGAYYKQCIPYEGNEHLIGTTNKPK
jgi:hypothetical protein